MKCNECRYFFECGTVRTRAKDNKREFTNFINNDVDCIDYEKAKKHNIEVIENYRKIIKG